MEGVLRWDHFKFGEKKILSALKTKTLRVLALILLVPHAFPDSLILHLRQLNLQQQEVVSGTFETCSLFYEVSNVYKSNV